MTTSNLIHDFVHMKRDRIVRAGQRDTSSDQLIADFLYAFDMNGIDFETRS